MEATGPHDLPGNLADRARIGRNYEHPASDRELHCRFPLIAIPLLPRGRSRRVTRWDSPAPREARCQVQSLVMPHALPPKDRAG
jgi:hypothetical protein